MQVFLDRVDVTRMGLVGARAGAAKRSALAQQIPAAVQLDGHVLQALAVGGERILADRVALLATDQRVLLVDQRLDAAQNRLVVHAVRVAARAHRSGYAS